MTLDDYYKNNILQTLGANDVGEVLKTLSALVDTINDFAIFGSFTSGCIAYPHDVKSLPKIRAVYCIEGNYADSGSLYIGSTLNLRKRFLHGHHVNKYVFSNKNVLVEMAKDNLLALTWMDCGSLTRAQINQLEKEQIKARVPMYNQMWLR